MAETAVTKRIAVVTGANKGIGFEICKQLASNGILVILTARDVKKGTEAVEKLKAMGLPDVVFHPLDVVDEASVASLAEFIKTHFGELNILVNNAGIIGSEFKEVDEEKLRHDLAINADLEGRSEWLWKTMKQTYETAQNCLKTNYYGTKQVTKALIPILEQSKSARIVNVSSGLGQLKYIKNELVKKELGDVEELTEEKIDKIVEDFLRDFKLGAIETNGWPTNASAYCVSKAALNGYTRILANKYPKIVVNAVSPGYTATDINLNSGFLTVEEGAQSPVKFALEDDGGPSGLFFERTEVSAF